MSRHRICMPALFPKQKGEGTGRHRHPRSEGNQTDQGAEICLPPLLRSSDRRIRLLPDEDLVLIKYNTRIPYPFVHHPPSEPEPVPGAVCLVCATRSRLQNAAGIISVRHIFCGIKERYDNRYSSPRHTACTGKKYTCFSISELDFD